MPLLPNRRWLRFSIRTLLTTVTIFCVWLGWQVSIVRERRQLIEFVVAHGGLVEDHWPGQWIVGQPTAPESVRLSWIRTALGDKPINEIVVQGDPDSDEDDRIRLRSVFPEADVICPGFDDQGS